MGIATMESHLKKHTCTVCKVSTNWCNTVHVIIIIMSSTLDIVVFFLFCFFLFCFVLFFFQYQGPLKESNAFKLICDEDLGIRGSCPSYFVRENVTQQIRGQEEYTSLETTYKRYAKMLKIR